MASTFEANQWVGAKLTKRQVDAAPLPQTGQVFIRDTELKGFALRVTSSGAKSFIIEKRIGGKVRRITLGRYPALTAEQARIEAQKQLGAIAGGHDPIKAKQEKKIRGITLHEAFKAFRQARRHLKPKTIYDYNRVLTVALDDWLSKPLSEISKDMVVRRYQKLIDEHGSYYATLTMRVLRTVINFAIAQYEDADGNPIVRDNPVMRLTRIRAWIPMKRRQTVIKPHQLAAWYGAVMRLREERPTRQAETIADYLRLLLFTGLRRSEGANLRWADVDLKYRTLTIPNTKNQEPLTLPLSDFLIAMLKERQEEARGDYVFPGEGHPGPLIEPRCGVRWVTQESGVAFILHDLRRTFITVADGLDISAYAVKRLVNHKMSHDVTAGYIVTDVERLRVPMQRVTDYLLSACGLRRPPQVIPLRVLDTAQDSPQ
jgi:integrase